jgi:hypothetical protein
MMDVKIKVNSVTRAQPCYDDKDRATRAHGCKALSVNAEDASLNDKE